MTGLSHLLQGTPNNSDTDLSCNNQCEQNLREGGKKWDQREEKKTPLFSTSQSKTFRLQPTIQHQRTVHSNVATHIPYNSINSLNVGLDLFNSMR